MGHLSRRDFLKLLGAAGTSFAFTPFVPFGNYMPNPAQAAFQKVPVLYEKKDNLVHANVFDFPTNHYEVVTYPRTGDATLDKESFRKYQLIRLPEELGGKADDVSSFRFYSMVCLHLWCLWEYKTERKQMECPCHGSEYNVLNGKAVKGPASVQAPPTNVLPKLDLEKDKDGFLYILPPKFNANDNGVVGYGRFS